MRVTNITRNEVIYSPKPLWFAVEQITFFVLLMQSEKYRIAAQAAYFGAYSFKNALNALL